MRARWPARTMAALTLLAAPGLAGAQTLSVKAGGTDDCPTVPASVGCENALPGGALQVPLTVDMSEASPEGIDVISVRLSWDPGLLTFQSSTDGPLGAVVVDDTDADTGSLDVSVTGAASTGTFDMARLTFAASSASGWNTLSVQVLSALDDGGADQLPITSGERSAVCIGLRGLLGDATDDGDVDIIDAQQIARWALALEVLPETQRALDEGLGEVTDDGTTDVIDAQQIVRHLVGLPAAEAIEDPLAGCTGPLPTVQTETVEAFATAFGGNRLRNGDNVILKSALLTDELIHSGTWPTRQELDRRDVPGLVHGNHGVEESYELLNHARQKAEEEAEALQKTVWDATLDDRIPLFLGLAGYSYVLFAETWCSGVSFTDLDEDGEVVTPGPPLTTAQMLDTAVARFDEGLSLDPTDSIAHLLRLGKARALLGLGDLTRASSEAVIVPTDFVFSVGFDNERQNAVHAFISIEERYSLADSEGVNGLPFRTAADPRVPFELDPVDGVGWDRETPQHNLLKYPSLTAPIPLATGEEARYIEAEELLDTDQAAVLGLLNDVRARYGLAALTPALPLPDDEILALLFEERAFTLLATGHRLGDLRRMIVQHGADAGSIFPVGPYHKLYPDYDADVNLPLPQAEVDRNPLTSGCFDRNP